MSRILLPAIMGVCFAIGTAGVADAVKRGTAAPEAPAFVVLLAGLTLTSGALSLTAAIDEVAR